MKEWLITFETGCRGFNLMFLL